MNTLHATLYGALTPRYATLHAAHTQRARAHIYIHTCHVAHANALASGRRLRRAASPALAKQSGFLKTNWNLSMNRDKDTHPAGLDHPDHAELWRRFLEGRYDPENPPAGIREWIRLYRNSPLVLGLESPSYTIVPAGPAADGGGGNES